jgi:antitoxin (DNA-binding transcriptional repressor) of toxin-antitoxin stability system
MRSKELMDAVEHGQAFTVTRDGRSIGELVPLRQRRRFVSRVEFAAMSRPALAIDAGAFRGDQDAAADQARGAYGRQGAPARPAGHQHHAAARYSAGPSSLLPIVQLAATGSRTLCRPGPSCTRSRTSGPTYHPRSMSFYDTCVTPRYRNGPAGRRRLTGAEAFELESMDPRYIDIDGFWPKGADGKGPESVPIAN